MTTKDNKKIAVITGAKGYLGTEIVRTLSENKYMVHMIELDITDEASMQEEAQRVSLKYDKVSALIHCASALLTRKPLLDISGEEFNIQVQVNAFGAFTFFKYFTPFLKQNGTIIGITSSASDQESVPFPSGSYIPAKHALRGVLRVLSNELKEVRVYAVSPAFMPGGLNDDLSETVLNLIRQKSETKDHTTPSDVARTVFYLINDIKGTMHKKIIAVPTRKPENL